MHPRPTIVTVAAQARVSIKTVSRVINHSTGVTDATRDHVMGVIRRLRFSPSPTARSLAGHRSWLVGLPFDSSAARYVTDLQIGSLPTCHAANYQVVMHACEAYAPDVVDEIRLFVQRVRVDGIILTPPLSHLDAVANALDDEGVPFVRIASPRRTDFARNVFTDERAACAGMTQHLADLGHVRIGFVRGPADHATSGQRYLGYCDGLKARELDLDPALVVQGSNSVAAGTACARGLLGRPLATRPTAIFASNDEMAAGVLGAAHEMGIAVPAELSVAGFEDAPIARQVWPRLTTIRQPIQAMAERATGLLMQHLRGARRECSLQLVESSLVIRQSTARVLQRQAS